MRRAYMFAKVRISVAAITLLAALAGCGGGAPTTENPNLNGQVAAASYNGPPPATADIQAFKLNFWDNLQGDDRCGTCHKPTQSPRFVRADDINLAYQEANTVVDLTNPGLSRIVAKVRGGHHCWLNDNNACGDTMTRWIAAWASVTSGGGGKTIQLTAPTPADPGSSKSFPTDPSAFAATVWPVLKDADKGNCSRCHTAESAAKQQPYFASADLPTAYAAAQAKINLDSPAMSRLVLRLRNESHNCWRVGGPANPVDCAASAQVMEDAIRMFANGITPTAIPPAWVTSKALTMYDGTVASGGTRFDNNAIALYEFKTGSGTIAYDTSGVSPALDLTLSGGYNWVGGWGIQFTGGKAQGLTTSSKKLTDLIGTTGEYTIEAWANNANVAQVDSRIVSYSGGLTVRNFSLTQSTYNYNFLARTANSNTNGTPALSTADAAKVAQAALQHVVVTFDPINGRRIYVNGVYTNTGDSSGSALGTWDDTLAFVLGNEASNNRPWLGTLKLVAIHNRALTPTQIKQNFDAGVGEKYLVLFGVSHITNVPQSYVMFEVSQYDSYAYLFANPKFISLDPTALPGSIPLKGMRIGINGTEPVVGQAYKPLDITITNAMYSNIAGASLSTVGTIINLEKGPSADQFFLTFEQLGSMLNVRTEAAPLAPQPPPNTQRPPDIGVRTFDALNDSMSAITGVSKNVASIKTTFGTIKQALPAVENFQGFLASHQIAVAQLAIAYCSEMVDSPSLRSSFFGSANFNASLTTQPERDAIINPIVAKVSGTGLASQPSATALHDELDLLISNSAPGRAQGLCVTAACGPSRTAIVAKAACAAAMGGGTVLIQ